MGGGGGWSDYRSPIKEETRQGHQEQGLELLSRLKGHFIWKRDADEQGQPVNLSILFTRILTLACGA